MYQVPLKPWYLFKLSTFLWFYDCAQLVLLYPSVQQWSSRPVLNCRAASCFWCTSILLPPANFPALCSLPSPPAAVFAPLSQLLVCRKSLFQQAQHSFPQHIQYPVSWKMKFLKKTGDKVAVLKGCWWLVGDWLLPAMKGNVEPASTLQLFREALLFSLFK